MVRRPAYELPPERLYGDEFRHDPAQVYGRLLTLGPIAPVWLEPRVPGWVIVDYNTLVEVSRDPGTWSHDSRLWTEWSNGRVPGGSDPSSARLCAYVLHFLEAFTRFYVLEVPALARSVERTGASPC